jgi:hypothetical protein
MVSCEAAVSPTAVYTATYAGLYVGALVGTETGTSELYLNGTRLIASAPSGFNSQGGWTAYMRASDTLEYVGPGAELYAVRQGDGIPDA